MEATKTKTVDGNTTTYIYKKGNKTIKRIYHHEDTEYSKRRDSLIKYIDDNPRQENDSILKQYKKYHNWCKDSEVKPYCYGIFKKRLLESEPDVGIEASNR